MYFSLGSVAQGQSMPTKYRDMFVEAFKQLKQRVIWKYEVALEGVSDNVLMRKWLPQQDILGELTLASSELQNSFAFQITSDNDTISITNNDDHNKRTEKTMAPK